MANFTPGPWAWTYDGCNDYSIGPADDPQDKCVARVCDRDGDRGMANCNLIAAAPDMLAACQALMNADHHDHFAARMSDSEMAAIEAIKAAIAKALRD